MFKVNDYIRFQGRVLIISHVDEMGIFAEDVDFDQSFFIPVSEFGEVSLF